MFFFYVILNNIILYLNLFYYKILIIKNRNLSSNHLSNSVTPEVGHLTNLSGL